ncbi:MAG TPA: type III pantothenate kinase [Bacteroidetes bacterium]|nr:type III pantothenate kinase [Bacteroidota bacterium]
MKKNFLCIDFGNTRIKAGIFENDELKNIFSSKNISPEQLKKIISANKIESGIISSVTSRSSKIETEISKLIHTIILSEKTPVPIINKYSDKKKLGKDRLASAVAAVSIFPKQNVLSINCGTCIIYDFVNDRGEYLGGSISPGMQMRLNALHDFTDKLPKVKADFPLQKIGNNTEQSILSGVMMGIIYELSGMIDDYKREHKNLKVILSGGDADQFASHLKTKIFASPHLVIRGLYQILKFNVETVL